MNLSEFKYIEFTGKHIAIAAAGVAILLMAGGVFQTFFSRLIVIIACVGGVAVAGMIAFDNYQNQKTFRKQPAAPTKPRPEVKPVIINLVENSGAIPDPTTLLKYMGIDQLQQPVINNPGFQGCADQGSGLLNVVINLDCLMIWGGRGAGKTNFIQHLALEKVNMGEELWIIDPKPSKPGKWPKGVNVIGQGHDYENIMTISEKYDFELQCRKAQFHDVQNFPKVTLIVDELYLLNLKIKGFMDMILPLLLEGREYNIHMMLISQSKTAGSLGLKGRYDLLECFDAIVGLERNGEKYSAVVDFGRGDIEHIPPGAYKAGRSARYQNHENRSQCHSSHTQNTVKSRDNDHDTRLRPETATLNYNPGKRQYAQFNRLVYDTKEHKTICEMHLRGNSLNNIARKVWGATNGRRTVYIKSVLAEYNLL